MADIYVKLSELSRPSTPVNDSDVVFISQLNNAENISSAMSISDLRDLLNFETAFETTTAGLSATTANQIFYVYTDGQKLAVNPYYNRNGVAEAIVDSNSNKLVYSTLAFLQQWFTYYGYSLIKEVPSFASLRTLPVLVEGQKVKLRSYYADGTTGGGEFIGRIGTKTDDGGMYASGNGFYWERVYDKTKQEINVLWFGADPTGVLSSTASFQSALNFLTTGGRITVPAGRFSIRSLTYTYDYTELVGAGINATILFSPSPTKRGWMIKMNGLTECALKNLTMDSLYTSVEGSFWMGGGVRCVVDSCSFLNGHFCSLSINGANGVSGGGRYAYDNVVRNCYAAGQRNYHPTGTSPFIAGNGAAYTVFENCIVENCAADAYDADSAPYTRFVNCIARQTGDTRSTFAGFWSEGLVSEFTAQTGFTEYVVFWENCRAEGYQIGIGTSEDVKGNITNPMIFNCNRGLWLRTNSTVNGGLISGCGVSNSGAETPFNIETSSKISGTKVVNTSSSNAAYIYNGSFATDTPLTFDNVSFDKRVYVYTGNVPKFIDFTNCVFVNGGVSWYNTGNNTYLIANCLFIDSVIAGARCKHARVVDSIFIDNNNTLTAIQNQFDTYNTFVYDCHFDGFSAITTTATLGKNSYINCTTVPTSNREFVIKSQITLPTAGVGVTIPMGGGFARGAAIIIAQGSSNDNCCGVYVLGATSNTSTRTITPLLETADPSTGNKFTVAWASGGSPTIAHPIAGRVVNITVLNYA